MTNERELVGLLNHLVSLDDPRFGGPYEGLAARRCVDAMRQAAALIERLAAERDEARAELATRDKQASSYVKALAHEVDASMARGKAEAQDLLAEALAALEPLTNKPTAYKHYPDASPRLVVTTEGHLRTARAVRDKIKGAGG